MFLAGEASRINALPSVIYKYNQTIPHKNKMTHIQASKKSNEKDVYSNLQDRRDRQQPRNNLGQLVRTADIKRIFRKGDSTNWSYILYTINEIIF